MAFTIKFITLHFFFWGSYKENIFAHLLDFCVLTAFSAANILGSDKPMQFEHVLCVCPHHKAYILFVLLCWSSQCFNSTVLFIGLIHHMFDLCVLATFIFASIVCYPSFSSLSDVKYLFLPFINVLCVLFWQAASNGRDVCVRELLQAGANKEATDNEGYTALLRVSITFIGLI